MLITEATREDLDGLVRLNHKVSRDRYSRELWQNYLNAPFVTYVVKDSENDIIAYVVLDKTNCDADMIDIISLGVDREHQTKGVATKLAEYIFTLEYPKQVFTVHVRKKSLRTIALYNSFGFDIDEIIKDYYTEPNDDALLMKWEPL